MSSNAETINNLGSKADNKGLGGQPRGITTLFFTEMWERFSFYGMRGILILYMTTEIAKGGLGWTAEVAAPIYALFASSVYFLPLIGGWIADRFIGARTATLIGGIIIMLGHFLLAFPAPPFFYAGLICVSIGTGFLKSNISKMVGDLYDKDDERRDGGFSIFYMGINLGAFAAPIIVGALAVYNWHWGFAAAGVGMAFGIIQYLVSWDRIKNVGLPPVQKAENEPSNFSPAYIVEMTILIVVTAAVIYFAGWPQVTEFIKVSFQGVKRDILLAYVSNPLMPSVVIASLIAVLLTGIQDGLSMDDWKRLGVIFVLFTFSTVFWMGFEQAATSLNLFAEHLANRKVFFGWEFPTAWLQSVNAFFLVLLAPVFSLIWVKMGKRQPSDTIKFSIGLFFGGLGFVVVAYASSLLGADPETVEASRVTFWWLVLVYFCHTIGELCLSPVGLSSMTKLAPLKMVSLMLGVWFLSISLGNYVAGMIGGEFEPTAGVLTGIFTKVAIIMIGAGILLAAITPLVKMLYQSRTEQVGELEVESH